MVVRIETSPFPLHPQLALQFGLGVYVELGVDVLGVAADGVFREVEFSAM